MRSRLPRNAFTHFLRIPLATSKSTPELMKSLEQVAQDPIAAALPRQVWSAPDSLHIVIGELNLKGPGRLDLAAELLEKLDLIQILSLIAPSTALPLSRTDNTAVSRASRGTGHPAQIATVALQGLDRFTPNPSYPNATKTLKCYIKERVPFLIPLCSQISNEFLKANLMPIPPKPPSPLAMIMSTSWFRTNVPNRALHLKGKRSYREPLFDASKLYPKYEDFLWTTEFPLEQVCISEVGLKDVWRKDRFIRTAYRNIASIQFPGVVASQALAEHPDDVYVKAAKTIRENLEPIDGLIIPSMSPS